MNVKKHPMTKAQGGGAARQPIRLELKSERVQDTSPDAAAPTTVLVAELALASTVPGLKPVQVNLAVALD